jgi:hypothetical protein
MENVNLHMNFPYQLQTCTRGTQSMDPAFKCTCDANSPPGAHVRVNGLITVLGLAATPR